MERRLKAYQDMADLQVNEIIKKMVAYNSDSQASDDLLMVRQHRFTTKGTFSDSETETCTEGDEETREVRDSDLIIRSENCSTPKILQKAMNEFRDNLAREETKRNLLESQDTYSTNIQDDQLI